ALAPGGALTLHLGSPVAQPQRVADLAQRLNSVFRIVRVYTMYIPLYGSLWSMAVCSDKLDPKAFTADEIDRRIEARKMQELRYYNGETHEGVFALPNFVRDLVTPARLKQPARGRRLGVVRAASKYPRSGCTTPAAPQSQGRDAPAKWTSRAMRWLPP